MVTREKAQAFVETLSWLMGFAAASDWDDLLLRVPDHLEEMREHFRGMADPDGGTVWGRAMAEAAAASPAETKSADERATAAALDPMMQTLDGAVLGVRRVAFRCGNLVIVDAGCKPVRCGKREGHDGPCQTVGDYIVSENEAMARGHPEWWSNRIDVVGKPQFYRCREKKILDPGSTYESIRQCRLNEGHAGDHLWHPEKGDRP